MGKIATREAYGQALAKVAKDNSNIIVLDADLSKSTKTNEVKIACPTQHINCGIAEANMIGIAGGLATVGKIPVVSSFAMFLAGRGFEQIRNTIAYPRLNVKLCATHAGITVGEDGASHQAIEDISLMRSIPNMVVLSPASGLETAAVIEEIIKYDGPCYVRLGRLASDEIYESKPQFKFGCSDIVQGGDKLTILTHGFMTHIVLNAIKNNNLEQVEVVNMTSIKPLDEQTILTSVKKTNRVIVVEEHSIIGGLGSAVTELLATEYPLKVRRVGIKDQFGESGKPEELLAKHGLDEDSIAKIIKEELCAF